MHKTNFLILLENNSDTLEVLLELDSLIQSHEQLETLSVVVLLLFSPLRLLTLAQVTFQMPIKPKSKSNQNQTLKDKLNIQPKQLVSHSESSYYLDFEQTRNTIDMHS